jgi:toxin CptA
MHSAPPVNYPVGRSRNAERLLLILWGLGVFGVSIACVQSGALCWREGILLLSAVVVGTAAWTGVRRCSAPADLTFDGQHWTMSGSIPVRTARASVALDLQFLLLICLTESVQIRRWIWLDRNAMPAQWQDLRRALYSRAAPTDPATRAPDSIGANAPHSSS